jgi:hypothetical protein
MYSQEMTFQSRAAPEYPITYGARGPLSLVCIIKMLSGLLRRREILVTAWVLALVRCICAVAIVHSENMRCQ